MPGGSATKSGVGHRPITREEAYDLLFRPPEAAQPGSNHACFGPHHSELLYGAGLEVPRASVAQSSVMNQCPVGDNSMYAGPINSGTTYRTALRQIFNFSL